MPFGAAEDLILHKLFAAGPHDVDDAAGVAWSKRREFDWHYLERWAREFPAVPGREGMPAALNRLGEELEP